MAIHRITSRSLALVAAASAALSSTARAQCATTSTLVDQGTQVVPGLVVDQILGLAVDDQGGWAVEFDATLGPGNSTAGVLQSGVPVVLQHVPLDDPPGALLFTVDALSLDGNGNLLMLILHDGGPGGPNGSDWYWNGQPLGVTGAAVTGDLPPGTTIEFIIDPSLNANGTIVARAKLLPSDQFAIVRIELDLASGTPTSVAVLYLEGDSVAGEPLLWWTSGQLATNDAAEVMFAATVSDPPFPGTSEQAVFLNDAVLAKTGGVEPSSGRTWEGFESIALGNGGDWAIAGEFAFVPGLGSEAIVRNGEVLIMEDEPLASIAPAIVTDISDKPISISEAGEVLWFGTFWSPATGTQAGLFIDDELIVQEHVTPIAGGIVTQLQGGFDWFKLSPSGRYVAFEATVSGVGDGVFLLERSAVGPLGTQPFGTCAGNAGCLGSSGSTAPGAVLTLTMDAGQQPGATALLALSSALAPGAPPCGLSLPGSGALLVDIAAPNPFATLEQVWSGTPARFALDLPTAPQLQGLPIYAQGVFIDAGPEPLRLTNGVQFAIGG